METPSKNPSWGDLAPNASQEFLFDLWAKEAYVQGLIVKVHEFPEKFTLSDEISYTIESEITIYKGTKREQQKKVYKKVKLLNGCIYGADRLIQWAPRAKGKFFSDIKDWKFGHGPFFKAHLIDGNWWSWLDVKSPQKGVNSSDLSFSIKRKWLWQQKQIFINEVICYPNKKKKNTSSYLWPSTFTPERYFWTDKLTKLRTINKWKPKTLTQWMK